jgi:hypothetical protein
MYADNARKLIIVLNAKHPLPQLLNGAFHAVAGLVPRLRADELDLLAYVNEAVGLDARISRYPNIVLTARNGGQLLRLHQAAREEGIASNLFTASMLAASADAQREQTRLATAESIEPMAIALFGEADRLQPHTKRFSLFRAEP